MQSLSDIQSQLARVVEDSAISGEEKAELRQLMSSLEGEKLSFLRNRAFDIARQQIAADEQQAMNVLRWLEQITKLVDNAARGDAVESEAYFSPGDACRNKLRDLFHTVKHSVDICVFTISDDKLRDAIIEAHQRGVRIRIITDNDKSEDRGSDIDSLAEQGVSVVQDSSPYHMHHKFAIFDNDILVNGSFNWTRSASRNNEENIVAITSRRLTERFRQQFDKLWQEYQT